MTERERTITHMQETWENIKSNIPLYRNRLGFECETILKALTDLGFDVSKGEGFSILEQDLTKKDFDKIACRAWILQSLTLYHSSYATDAKYLGEAEGRKYHTLGRLIKTFLPIAEKYVAKVDNLSEVINTFELAEFNFLRTASQTGLLETAYKIAALDFAIEATRGIFYYLNDKNPNLSDYRQGLSKASSALEAIEAAQEYYSPREIHAEYNPFGGYKPHKIEFSKEYIERAKDLFFFKETAIEFEQAHRFHKGGHYVLDASGSGHGMMQLPMQHIAEKLEKNGYDINSPLTFERFGTDIETFWSCYETERLHAADNQDYKKLIAPRLKR